MLVLAQYKLLDIETIAVAEQPIRYKMMAHMICALAEKAYDKGGQTIGWTCSYRNSRSSCKCTTCRSELETGEELGKRSQFGVGLATEEELVIVIL